MLICLVVNQVCFKSKSHDKLTSATYLLERRVSLPLVWGGLKIVGREKKTEELGRNKLLLILKI